MVLLAAQLAFALAPGAQGALAAPTRKLGEGDAVFRTASVPAVFDVALRDTLTPAERAYLGLAPTGPLSLGAIPGDLLVVEFFNSSCYACALMAPVMDQVWEQVQRREDLKDRVRIIGVGAGNTDEQVREFHARYATPFPMIADPEFAAYDALGTVEGTPYLALVRRRPGAAPAVRAQVGYIPRADVVVAAIVDALADGPPAAGLAANPSAGGWRTLKPPLSAAEIDARLVTAAAQAGLPGATVSPVRVSDDEIFYRLSSGGRSLWAMVAGRAKVCNVCHDIFFIVVFDDAGLIVELAPISITKYKNVEFDEKDVAFLRGRVVGRLLSRDIVFDPTVDAVSAATMSSALVFDTLRRLRETWASMVKAGLAKP